LLGLREISSFLAAATGTTCRRRDIVTNAVRATGGPTYLATYRDSDAEYERFDIPAEDILEGSPYAEVAVYHEAADGAVLVAAARISAGKYRYRQTADEINYVTAGRMLISSDRDDTTIECVPGSVTRLDKGAVYTKTVLEPYEEISVMFSDSTVQM